MSDDDDTVSAEEYQRLRAAAEDTRRKAQTVAEENIRLRLLLQRFTLLTRGSAIDEFWALHQEAVQLLDECPP